MGLAAFNQARKRADFSAAQLNEEIKDAEDLNEDNKNNAVITPQKKQRTKRVDKNA